MPLGMILQNSVQARAKIVTFHYNQSEKEIQIVETKTTQTPQKTHLDHKNWIRKCFAI